MSVDPALASYLGNRADKLPGQGGVFNPVNLALYCYAGNNPIKYTDPNGMSIVDDAKRVISKVWSFITGGDRNKGNSTQKSNNQINQNSKQSGSQENSINKSELRDINYKDIVSSSEAYISQSYEQHPIETKGVDIAAPEGTKINTPYGGYGYLKDEGDVRGGFQVIIAFKTLSGEKYSIAFMHQQRSGEFYDFYIKNKNSSSILVPYGIIKSGELAGFVGNTGNSTGPHTHVGLYKNYYTPVDPKIY